MAIEDRQFGSFEFDIAIQKWRRLVKDTDTIALLQQLVDGLNEPIPVIFQSTLVPIIQNISILQNVELTIPLPVNTQKVLVRSRKNGRLRMAFNIGDTASNYISSGLGGTLVEESVQLLSNIYILCDRDSELEIIFYIYT